MGDLKSGKEKRNICVSVFMLAYNQENFIAQAIESVLIQETNFSYQLVIGEDCSTDGTREICQKYAKANPDKIKLLLNEGNIGLGANYVKTYKECTGKYIAICDGDDYWIDSLKLQKQVDFLERNNDYSVVYTNNYNLFPSGEINELQKVEQSLITTFKDLVFGNYIPSVTVMFKNKALTEKMEEWMPSFPYGDWPTYLLILNGGGKIYFLNEITAVYRKNFGTSTGLRKTKSKMGEINVSILSNLAADKNFLMKKELIEKAILKFNTGLMASYNKEKRFRDSFIVLKRILKDKDSYGLMKIYLYSLKRTFFKNQHKRFLN